MYLVGLTGGIATGKSTVSDILKSLNVSVIDADIIARRVVEPGKRAWKQIRETFGNEVFHEDGTLNRPALGAIIFENEDKRRQLNGITHPQIFKEMLWEIICEFFKGSKFVILDLPLLFESGMWVKYIEKVVVVSCNEDLQIQRLMSRNQLSKSDAVTRIQAQIPLAEKCSKADFIIDNSGAVEETRIQVSRLHSQLASNKVYLKYRITAISLLSVVVGGISLLVTWTISKLIGL